MSRPLLNARDVAEYFLAKVDEESADITNLKLQKLLYYAQGFHLAIHGEQLFGEPIMAWIYGPVVARIYHSYKEFGRKPIEKPEQHHTDDLAPEVQELLDAVQNVYGQFSAWKLRDMTHNEPPWSDTPEGQEIPIPALREFFLKLVDAGNSGNAMPGEPLWPTNSFRHQQRKEIMKSAPKRDQLRTILDRVPSPDPWADDDED